MREIGSEFWDVPTTNQQNNIFPESAQWYLSGRSALQAIIEDLGDAKKVCLPSWCCDSMIKPFADAGIDVQFYPVYWQNGIVQEPCSDCDVLFLIDYFGYSTGPLALSSFKGIVIRDVTHSLFSSDYSDADYYFGSLRKWCGVWTGGYAWTDDGHPLQTGSPDPSDFVSLRKTAMRMKESYLRDGQVCGKEYLTLFDEAEDILEQICIAPAAERDVLLAAKIDVEVIKARRRANAEILRSSFPDWLIFKEMKKTDCPMFVPVFVPDGRRNELRRYLIQNDIYCPVHWPVSEYHKLNDKTAEIYQNELSLVCDQRYTEADMRRIVEVVRLFFEEA